MRKIYLVILFCCLLPTAFAQSARTYRLLGDKAFAIRNYYEAAYYYAVALGERPPASSGLEMPFHSNFRKNQKLSPADSVYLLYQLAESDRLFENYNDAGKYYQSVLAARDHSDYPLTRLWYGICLRANRQMDEAITQLTQFRDAYQGDSKYQALADREIENCHFAKEQYALPPEYYISKLDGPINSGAGNYSLSPYKNGFMFTSSRYSKAGKKNTNGIYYAALHDTIAPKLVSLESEDAKSKEYGTPSVDRLGKRMYFTVWYKKDDKIVTAIYLSEHKSNNWSVPQLLNTAVNEQGYNSKQPFVTADGRKLYFASNKPGGRGGDDIWVSDLADDGQPLSSTNLGSTINTPFDEQAPFYDTVNSRLVYSSKGFTGMGGFDIFEATNDGTAWSAPRNLGYPLNSTKDDLYYLQDKNDPDKFYLSSDRESDCCFSVFEGKIKTYLVAGQVVDCSGEKPLAGVKITYTSLWPTQKPVTIVTDSTGKYVFTAKGSISGEIGFERDGYASKTVVIVAKGEIHNDTISNSGTCLSKPRAGYMIKNIQFDFDSFVLTPKAKLTLDTLVGVLKANSQLRVSVSGHTDGKGGADYNQKLSEKRAESSVRYLLDNGITAERIQSKGFGKTQPLAPNTFPNGQDDPAGRRLNRRVEFALLQPGADE
ncbi:MAG: OmpA family protein [Bacteroidetes bacterium]|nr:OmpA family protein [Bacteroidota bacterium]